MILYHVIILSLKIKYYNLTEFSEHNVVSFLFQIRLSTEPKQKILKGLCCAKQHKKEILIIRWSVKLWASLSTFHDKFHVQFENVRHQEGFCRKPFSPTTCVLLNIIGDFYDRQNLLAHPCRRCWELLCFCSSTANCWLLTFDIVPWTFKCQCSCHHLCHFLH